MMAKPFAAAVAPGHILEEEVFGSPRHQVCAALLELLGLRLAPPI